MPVTTDIPALTRPSGNVFPSWPTLRLLLDVRRHVTMHSTSPSVSKVLPPHPLISVIFVVLMPLTLSYPSAVGARL
jgi:hypothetical protein